MSDSVPPYESRLHVLRKHYTRHTIQDMYRLVGGVLCIFCCIEVQTSTGTRRLCSPGAAHKRMLFLAWPRLSLWCFSSADNVWSSWIPGYFDVSVCFNWWPLQLTVSFISVSWVNFSVWFDCIILILQKKVLH